MTEHLPGHILEKTEDMKSNTVLRNSSSEKPTKFITGLGMHILIARKNLSMFSSIFQLYKNPFKTYTVLKGVLKLKKEVGRNYDLTRIVKVDGKYYWDMYTPGFPSKAFDKFIQSEANRIIAQEAHCNRFLNVIISITNKCSYKCEHCYEWDLLNKKEDLSLEELKTITAKFQKMGTALIHFSGGEPMLRLDDMIEVLRTADKSTQFWLASSGYTLDRTAAEKLKEAGLTGVSISLDDHRSERHNAFRGYKNAYDQALKAVSSCRNAGLVTALSICVAKENVNEDHLMSYVELARGLGVSLVQLLEPKAVGHYRAQDIELDRAQELTLETLYHKLNFSKGFEDYPIIVYHGHHQRKMGCFAAADRVIYVDGEGDINPCPFCKKKGANALDEDLDRGIEKLREEGCMKYDS